MLSFEAKQLLQVNIELQELSIHSEIPIEMNKEYERLFHLIGHSALRHVAGWNSILAKEEIPLMCEYLLEQSDPSEQEILAAIISSRVDKDILRYLYQYSQNHEKIPRLHGVLQYFHSNQKLAELFYQNYGHPWDNYITAILKNNVAAYINKVAGEGNFSSETGYAERLKSMGIIPASSLYLECSKLFITVCNGAEYMRLGAEEIRHMVMEQTDEVQVSLVKNMLRNLDVFQLRSFYPVLKQLYELVGNPGSRAYKELMIGLTPEEVDKHRIWLNQYKIVHSLKDKERNSFWVSYVKDCTIQELDDIGVLLLRFKDFTVIEFALENQVAYFYDNQYMEEEVNEGLAAASSADQLEEWLFQHTKWRAQGEYKYHWRKAHRDNWQTDMRDYIFQRIKG